MKRSWRIVVGFLLLPVAGFCVFGFLSSFEPGPFADFFIVAYGVVGLGCLAAAGWLFFRR